jgi:hypothetical protein
VLVPTFYLIYGRIFGISVDSVTSAESATPTLEVAVVAASGTGA